LKNAFHHHLTQTPPLKFGGVNIVEEGDNDGDGEWDNVGDGEGGLSVEDNDEGDEYLGSQYDDDDDNDDDDSLDGQEILDREGYTDENVDDDVEGNFDGVNQSIGSDLSIDESFVLYGVDDIVKMEMFNLQNEDVAKLQFRSLQVAYNFYCCFAKMNGFAIRKGQVIKNKHGDVLQQTFVFNLEGFRKDIGLTAEERKRSPKHETRCGAKFRVHINVITHC